MALTTRTTTKNKKKVTETGVEAYGSFYPTSNPDFTPSAPGTNTQIKFNDNGSVDYTPKGGTETFNLSKQEYQAILGNPGFITEKTKKIQAQQLNPLQAQQDALAEQQATELKSLGQEDFTKLGEQPTAFDTSATQNIPEATFIGNRIETRSPEAIQQQNQAEMATQGAGLAGSVIGAGLLGGNLIGGTTLKLAPTLSKAKTAITSLRNIKILGAIGTVYGFLTNAKVNDIEGNINDMVSISKTMASQVSSGADPVEVRQQLVDMENEIRDKIAEMNIAKRYSIKDRIIGSDTQEYARKQLTLIALRRQAVERYMLTNDLNAFNSFMGAQSLE